jgi:xanthine phosphoribosyltransferase
MADGCYMRRIGDLTATYDVGVDLHQAIATRARVDGDLIMVDDFLNHRVDPDVMRQIGVDMAKEFADLEPGLVLAAEASGIPPALACASKLSIPMVYAKKYLGTGNRYTFAREAASPTKGTEYSVGVARRVLSPGTRVLIIDDFLARGRAAEALGEITLEAGCELVAFGFVIEKAWAEGRLRLEKHNWPVTALVSVTGLNSGSIEFV